MSFATTRSKDWDDIVTTHSDETFARTWTMSRKRLGKYSFGLAADPNAKGKDKGTVGAAKVAFDFLFDWMLRY